MSEYLHGHHDSVLRSHRWRTAENSAGHLLPHLRPGMRVLDVGCGPGTITADLGALVGPTGSVAGVDAAADVVEQARSSVDAPNVRFEVGDVMALEHDDDTFDVVHAHQVLQHLTDPVGALREMGRVTRPGGLVAVRDADYAAMTWHPADPRLDRWLDLYRAAARSLGAEPDAGRQLLAWAHAAGFEDVEPTTTAWCFATPEDRAWWGDLWAERTTASGVATRTVDAGLATAEDLADVAEGWRSWAAEPDGWFAVLHGELVCRIPEG